jgi:hypothetical protein
VRVLIDLSPPLLVEAIIHLLRRSNIVICMDLAADRGESGPVEIAITDRTRLSRVGAQLVVRLPGEPPPRRRRTLPAVADEATPDVVDLTDVSDLVRLVDDFADGVKHWRR